MKLLLLIALAFLTVGCAPRCHVRSVQWFDFINGQTFERTVSITVCDGGLHWRWK